VKDNLQYIIEKWDLDKRQRMPIKIPGTNRVTLAKLFEELGYRKGAEIGTARGSNALTLKRHNPELKLYCVDAWALYDGMHDFKDAAVLYEYELSAAARLNPLPDVKIIKAFSMDAVKKFDDETLDFVYIDANHELPYITEDIFYWAKKVKPGGIVSGHDYLKVQREDGLVQVKEAVHAYTEAFNIRTWFVVDKCTLERAGSWFWVKQ
jgi:predicted O-methyltransferase YrrM